MATQTTTTTCSTRRILAASTARQHEALHEHPLLRRLSSPAIKPWEYSACLRANLHFFTWVEARRTAARLPASAFSLAAEVQTLTQDLNLSTTPIPNAPDAQQSETLGALYVAHGSQFGRRAIRQTLAPALPGAPMAFFGLPNRPDTWSHLLATIETRGQCPHALEAMTSGATKAFAVMSAAADRALKDMRAAQDLAATNAPPRPAMAR